jgi:hypothetical protein
LVARDILKLLQVAARIRDEAHLAEWHRIELDWRGLHCIELSILPENVCVRCELNLADGRTVS